MTERQRERTTERAPERPAAMEYVGPLRGFEEYLDPAYEYRFGSYTRETPGRMSMYLKLGWVPVRQEEISGQENFLEKYGIVTARSQNADLVTYTDNKGITLYLMKIPKERYKQLSERHTDKVNYTEHQIRSKLQEAGGDSSSSAEFHNPFRNNHVFDGRIR